MLFQIFVVIVLFVIIYCLGSGLFYLVRQQDEKDSRNVAKALTWRIVLSLSLFALLLLAYLLGWIHPHGVVPG